MPESQPAFWSLKPWWCQPWSILLTGVLAIAGSHNTGLSPSGKLLLQPVAASAKASIPAEKA